MGIIGSWTADGRWLLLLSFRAKGWLCPKHWPRPRWPR